MFIGRKKELSSLKDIINEKNSTIGVVYGRRRIGKSELINQAFNKKKTLFFEGLENRPKQEQINSFLFQLFYQVKKDNKKKVKTWKDAFILLYEELKKKPANIILDEFQWMANYRSEIVSELKLIWDLYISKIKGTTLILCGSIASFMTTKVIKSNALYGRTNLIIHLKGFLLPDTKKMLAQKGEDEIIEAQMLFGGVPKYLDLIKQKSSVFLATEDLAFKETGYFVDEYDRIFLSHFGKSPEYEKIIKVLSKHPYGLIRQKIAKECNISVGGGLSNHLKNLESAGFISSSTPFNQSYKSRLQKYYLSDPYFRFYFSFIKPNLKKIKTNISDNIFSQISQTGAFYNWMGRSFEYLCIDHAKKISETLGFSGIEFTFGPYFKASKKNYPGTQIDLVFDRKDNVITLCEMKYLNKPVGINIINEVEKKVEILQNNFNNKTIQKVLITKSKPTKDLISSNYFYKIIKPKFFFDQ